MDVLGIVLTWFVKIVSMMIGLTIFVMVIDHTHSRRLNILRVLVDLVAMAASIAIIVLSWQSTLTAGTVVVLTAVVLFIWRILRQMITERAA